jgi:prepilin-type N-terminal cleavage/methylation domain-containing protein
MSVLQRRLAREKRGFTLVEVLVAMFILSVALLALAKIQSSALLAGDQAGKRSIALALAQDRIEWFQRDVLANGLTNVVDGNDACSGGAGDPATCPQLMDPSGLLTRIGAFTRTWVVDDEAPIWDVNMRQVTVTVTWMGGHVTLRSIISIQ